MENKITGFHSWWCGPGNRMNLFKDKEYMKEYERLVILASILMWQKHNGPMEIYCDEPFKEKLQEDGILQFYDNVNTDILERFEPNFNPKTFWAAGKIKVIRELTEPKASVDVDMIIWDNLSKYGFDKRDIVYSHKEHVGMFYPNEYGLQTPPNYKWMKDLDWSVKTNPFNTAFLLFNNDRIRKVYTNECFRFMNNNYADNSFEREMVFVEQRMLGMLSKKYNWNSEPLLPAVTPDSKLMTHIWSMKRFLNVDPEEQRRLMYHILRKLKNELPEDKIREIRDKTIFGKYINDDLTIDILWDNGEPMHVLEVPNKSIMYNSIGALTLENFYPRNRKQFTSTQTLVKNIETSLYGPKTVRYKNLMRILKSIGIQVKDYLLQNNIIDFEKLEKSIIEMEIAPDIESETHMIVIATELKLVGYENIAKVIADLYNDKEHTFNQSKNDTIDGVSKIVSNDKMFSKMYNSGVWKSNLECDLLGVNHLLTYKNNTLDVFDMNKFIRYPKTRRLYQIFRSLFPESLEERRHYHKLSDDEFVRYTKNYQDILNADELFLVEFLQCLKKYRQASDSLLDK